MKDLKASIQQVEKDKKVVESQFGVLDIEKSTLARFMEEANVARDEAFARAASLESEQTRLINVAKAKVEAWLAQVLYEKE